MAVEDFSFEQRPLSELPASGLSQWLADFNGDDQWVEGGRNVVRAAVVLGDHIIIWQDTPLTDEDKNSAVAEYEATMEAEATRDADGNFPDYPDTGRDSLGSATISVHDESVIAVAAQRRRVAELGEMRQARVRYAGGMLAVELKAEQFAAPHAVMRLPITIGDLIGFCDSVQRRCQEQDADDPRYYGPEGSGVEIGFDDTTTVMGSCGTLSFCSRSAALMIHVWPEDLDRLRECVAATADASQSPNWRREGF